MTIYKQAKTLEGVPYQEGWNDCYTSAREFYNLVLGIELKDFSRPRYWDQIKEFNFFERLFSESGFVEIGDNPNQASVGDALLMRIGNAVCLNHIAVYVGQNQILHHVQGRNRIVELYDHKWRFRVAKVIRHPDMEKLFNLGDSLSAANLPQSLKNKVYGGQGG